MMIKRNLKKNKMRDKKTFYSLKYYKNSKDFQKKNQKILHKRIIKIYKTLEYLIKTT
jgi:hypothetical protein